MEWETYEIPGYESRVYVEDGRVDRIGCYDELIFKGTNIIGLSLSEFRALFGPEDEIGEEFDGEVPVEFEKVGLQVWLRDDVVQCVICSGPIEDD